MLTSRRLIFNTILFVSFCLLFALFSAIFDALHLLPKTEEHSTVKLERRGSSESFDRLRDFVSTFPPPLRGPDARGVPHASDESNWYLNRRKEGRPEFDWPKMNKMFVFGDSFSNLNTDYRKNGVDGGHPGHLHNKATDMKWSDFLYAVYKDFHAQQYWSFARDGAVIDEKVIPPRIPSYGTLADQIKDFEDLFTPMPGPRNVDWHANDTLFIFAMGINDLRQIAQREYDDSQSLVATEQLAKSLIESAKYLHSLGAASFMFLNLPPLDTSPKYALPSEIGYYVRDIIGKGTTYYNDFLKTEVEAFDRDVTTVNAMMFDWGGFYNVMKDWPELFGLTEESRYQMYYGDRLQNLGRMGYWYHDPGHVSWTVGNLLARAAHGMLLRRSKSFWISNATEVALHV